MRHRMFGKRLDRPMAHRTAVLNNLARHIVMYGRIKTTDTRAKMLRQVIEPLITAAKKDGIAGARRALAILGNRDLVRKLTSEIAPLYKERNGGYTRIIKSHNRPGDNAPISIIELVDAAHLYKKEDPKAAKAKDAKERKEAKEEKKPKEKKEKKEKKEEKKEEKKAKK